MLSDILPKYAALLPDTPPQQKPEKVDVPEVAFLMSIIACCAVGIRLDEVPARKPECADNTKKPSMFIVYEVAGAFAHSNIASLPTVGVVERQAIAQIELVESPVESNPVNVQLLSIVIFSLAIGTSPEA